MVEREIEQLELALEDLFVASAEREQDRQQAYTIRAGRRKKRRTRSGECTCTQTRDLFLGRNTCEY